MIEICREVLDDKPKKKKKKLRSPSMNVAAIRRHFFARFHQRLKVPFQPAERDFQLFRVVTVIGKFFGRSTGVL